MEKHGNTISKFIDTKRRKRFRKIKITIGKVKARAEIFFGKKRKLKSQEIMIIAIILELRQRIT